VTLEEVLTLVLTAVRPHLHGRSNGATIEELRSEINKIFEEEPHVKAAFVAMVQTIAQAARR
jgi:ribosomal protein S3